MNKRLLDYILAVIGLAVSLPCALFIALLIKLEAGSPVLYIQLRVGVGGVLFSVYKFRTMGYLREPSPLASLLRKTALDELPQLWNIAKGDMSFVGPRPLIPEEIAQDERMRERLCVRPGLTGAAQLMAPKDAPVIEKLNYDLWYINNRNLLLDIVFILKSFGISLSRRWDKVGGCGRQIV
jgi:lipopolysaccharide/colanic/teichoic acid biosynthesis glycosyltransferase